MEINIDTIGKFPVIIKYFQDNSSEKSKHFPNTLTFEIEVPTSYDSIEIKSNSDEEISKIDKIAIYESVVADSFREQIFYFLITTQIAKPGTIKTKEGKVFVDGKLEHYFYPVSNIHRESFNQIEKMKWPKLKNLKFLQVWNWFIEHSFIFDRHSKTKMELALNAYTHLYDENSIDTVFDLFWALVGIEAIYCSGKEAISEQIFIKTQLVLGPLNDYKKKLKQMYDFRSRLVHGDLNIPPKHYSNDDSDDYTFHENLFDSAALAVAILTATLQVLISENKTELNFKYVVE